MDPTPKNVTRFPSIINKNINKNSIVRDSITNKNLFNIQSRLYRPHWK